MGVSAASERSNPPLRQKPTLRPFPATPQSAPRPGASMHEARNELGIYEIFILFHMSLLCGAFVELAWLAGMVPLDNGLRVFARRLSQVFVARTQEVHPCHTCFVKGIGNCRNIRCQRVKVGMFTSGRLSIFLHGRPQGFRTS